MAVFGLFFAQNDRIDVIKINKRELKKHRKNECFVDFIGKREKMLDSGGNLCYNSLSKNKSEYLAKPS